MIIFSTDLSIFLYRSLIFINFEVIMRLEWVNLKSALRNKFIGLTLGGWMAKTRHFKRKTLSDSSTHYAIQTLMFTSVLIKIWKFHDKNNWGFLERLNFLSFKIYSHAGEGSLERPLAISFILLENGVGVEVWRTRMGTNIFRIKWFLKLFWKMPA